MSKILVWFRSDLRLKDNPALFHAITKSKIQPRMDVVALYVLSPQEWKSHKVSPLKIDFILRNLKILSDSLWKEFRIPLIIKNSVDKDQVIQLVVAECSTLGVKHLLFNKEYEVNESIRDKKVTEEMHKLDILTHSFDDQVVVPPGSLRAKSSDNIYTVYSPFKKAWFELVHRQKSILLKIFEIESALVNADGFDIKPSAIPDSIPGFELQNDVITRMKQLYPAGEDYAQKKLEEFASASAIKDYQDKRNFPSLSTGTSGLSPYLASGVLSSKQCVVRAIKANNDKIDSGNSGIICWIQELIWRDFYRHILFGYPRVCKNKPFKLDTINLKWENDQEKFLAWCQGKTGYPIVDAGMRQMNETGWMHNRVRMIVASFLTKHLLQHWMKGEEYFMLHLIDGDFASNNGGWQWAASTGTDSQPYFRVFNPYLQSKKFDAKGEYIRKWIPELRSLKNNEAVHDPEAILGKAAVLKLGYVPKIVQHEPARKRAIEAFKSLTNASHVDKDGGDVDEGEKPVSSGTKKRKDGNKSLDGFVQVKKMKTGKKDSHESIDY